MASSHRFIDNMPNFVNKVADRQARALREAGSETLIRAKRSAPVDAGGLRRESDVDVITFKLVWVRFWAEYAGYQERGMARDGSRKVRRYTTAGTGAHFLENAGNAVKAKMGYIFKKHLRGIL